jgi:hypothetical protein
MCILLANILKESYFMTVWIILPTLSANRKVVYMRELAV